jgi:hypothetical protein
VVKGLRRNQPDDFSSLAVIDAGSSERITRHRGRRLKLSKNWRRRGAPLDYSQGNPLARSRSTRRRLLVHMTSVEGAFHVPDLAQRWNVALGSDFACSRSARGKAGFGALPLSSFLHWMRAPYRSRISAARVFFSAGTEYEDATAFYGIDPRRVSSGTRGSHRLRRARAHAPRWLLAEANREHQGTAHSCGTHRSFLRYSEKYLRDDNLSQT